jgi:uncharacterized protein YndB with AHSA1/START domain
MAGHLPRSQTSDPERLTIQVERAVAAPIQRVWQVWTTRSGLESWWGPEQIVVQVRRLDVRPEGAMDFWLRYAPALLTPDSPQRFAAAGVPIGFHVRGRFTEVAEPSLLAFYQELDLGKTAKPFRFSTRVELTEAGDQTRIKVIADGALSPHWSTLGEASLKAQLARLELALADLPQGMPPENSHA